MAAALDLETGVRHDFGAAPAALDSALGQRRSHVEPRDRVGRGGNRIAVRERGIDQLLQMRLLGGEGVGAGL